MQHHPQWTIPNPMVVTGIVIPMHKKFWKSWLNVWIFRQIYGNDWFSAEFLNKSATKFPKTDWFWLNFINIGWISNGHFLAEFADKFPKTWPFSWISQLLAKPQKIGHFRLNFWKAAILAEFPTFWPNFGSWHFPAEFQNFWPNFWKPAIFGDFPFLPNLTKPGFLLNFLVLLKFRKTVFVAEFLKSVLNLQVCNWISENQTMWLDSEFLAKFLKISHFGCIFGWIA